MIVTRSNGKIGAAAPVDPNATFIETPSLAVDAGCFTALANQANAADSIDAAAVEVEIVGRAIKCPRAGKARIVGVVAGTNRKVRSAAAINPDAVAGDTRP